MPDAASLVRPSTVGILGCGLIGGSIALGALDAGWTVQVYDPCEPAERLMAAGLVATPSADACVAGADLVVLATPDNNRLDAVTQVSAWPDGVVVTDVGSVKRDAVDELAMALPTTVRFVPGHPMAGKATHGFAAAEASLFHGATWVVCPGFADEMAVDLVSTLARQLGASRVLALEPEDHDAAVAAISHTVQATATALAAVIADVERDRPGTILLAGGGFRDTTRIAESAVAMWAPVWENNRDNVLPLMRAVAAELTAIADAVESHDADALTAIFDRAHAARAAFPNTVRGGLASGGVQPEISDDDVH